MVQLRSIVVASMAVAAISVSATAYASPANHVVADYGSISVPFTRTIGNAFTGTTASGFVSQDGTPVVTATVGSLNYFYDDYLFTLPTEPLVSFNAAAVTLDLANFLSLQNFSARLYKLDSGVASLTTGLPSSGTPAKPWTSSPLLGPGFSGTTVLFENVALQAGATYALEFRGTIAGAFGGSYGGNLNIVPVPEPTSASLVLASIGVLGLLARRRRG